MQLRLLAAKFHSHVKKSVVVRRFARVADGFGAREAQQHAAHVAAWIAYAPPDYVPSISVMKLLTQLLAKLGDGMLPSRLRKVLPKAQTSLEALHKTCSWCEEDRGWERARTKLICSLKKLRGCRFDQQGHPREAPVASSSEGAPPSAGLGDGDDLCECPSAAMQQLLREVNTWTSMKEEEKLQSVRGTETIAMGDSRNISQAELSEVLCQLAAALPMPHQSTQDEPGRREPIKASAKLQPLSSDLPRHVRTLLLKSLHAWRARKFELSNIRHILEYLQSTIRRFEERGGEIRCAASAPQWLAIQQAINDLLQCDSNAPDGVLISRRMPCHKRQVPKGTKKTTFESAMLALGGTATREQLVEYVRSHPGAIEIEGAEGVERSLKSFRPYGYFQLHGKRKGKDVFCLAQPVVNGVRRLKHGFAGKLRCRNYVCVGPLRAKMEDARKDYLQLKAWRSSMSQEALFQRVRRWEDAHINHSTCHRQSSESGVVAHEAAVYSSSTQDHSRAQHAETGLVTQITAFLRWFF